MSNVGRGNGGGSQLLSGIRNFNLYLLPFRLLMGGSKGATGGPDLYWKIKKL